MKKRQPVQRPWGAIQGQRGSPLLTTLKEGIVGERVGTTRGRVLVRHGEDAETGQTKRDTA